jgi:pimeloyl-ACP methyl ester carboxylesterase
MKHQINAATGSSYSLADHVCDLTCLMKSAGFEKVTIIGHSMGGMVSLTYAGVFPNKVSRLVVLDGVTNFPARRVKPADVRIADWVGDLGKFAQRKIHRYLSVADGAKRILTRNQRLTREQAMHLATYGLKWKCRRRLQLEVRSLFAHPRALSAIARRPYGAVVTHSVSDTFGQRQREFSTRSRDGRRDLAFQAGRIGQDRGRGPLASPR